VGIFELLPLGEDVRPVGGRDEIDAVHPVQTMALDGWQKISAGITTPEEVLRVLAI
jgi:type II secretory ATPase GspE/PulE/Tfp pilus assembly ATPase PilB-like protein